MKQRRSGAPALLMFGACPADYSPGCGALLADENSVAVP